MRVPRFLLRDTILIADFEGSGGRGRVYTPRAAPVRCSVQPTAKTVTTTGTGTTVTVATRVIIRPEDGPVRVESKVTLRGVTYSVLEAYPMPDERRPTQWELLIGILASGS